MKRQADSDEDMQFPTGTPEQLQYKPTRPREEIAAIEKTTDAEDFLDAIYYTMAEDISGHNHTSNP